MIATIGVGPFSCAPLLLTLQLLLYLLYFILLFNLITLSTIYLLVLSIHILLYIPFLWTHTHSHTVDLGKERGLLSSKKVKNFVE